MHTFTKKQIIFIDSHFWHHFLHTSLKAFAHGTNTPPRPPNMFPGDPAHHLRCPAHFQVTIVIIHYQGAKGRLHLSIKRRVLTLFSLSQFREFKSFKADSCPVCILNLSFALKKLQTKWLIPKWTISTLTETIL